jgi:hypothetical protein
MAIHESVIAQTFVTTPGGGYRTNAEITDETHPFQCITCEQRFVTRKFRTAHENHCTDSSKHPMNADPSSSEGEPESSSESSEFDDSPGTSQNIRTSLKHRKRSSKKNKRTSALFLDEFTGELKLPEYDTLDPLDSTYGGLLRPSRPIILNYRNKAAQELRHGFSLSKAAMGLCTSQAMALIIFRHLIELIIQRTIEQQGAKPHDLIQTGLITPELDIAVVSVLIPISEYSVTDFMTRIQNAMGSRDKFGIGDRCRIEVRTVSMPDNKPVGAPGYGGVLGLPKHVQRGLNQLKEWNKKRSGLWECQNPPDEKTCVAQCTAAYILKSRLPDKDDFRKAQFYRFPQRSVELRNETQSLYHWLFRKYPTCDVQDGFRCDQFFMVEQYLKHKLSQNAKLVVYDDQLPTANVIYPVTGFDPRTEKETLRLYINEGHCFWLFDHRLFKGARRSCPICLTTYSRNHVCIR